MKRTSLLLAVGLFVVAPWIPRAGAQTHKERAETARFVAGLQNPDGGFAGTAGGKSSLGATSSAIRILTYCGGSIPDVTGCIAYVESCFDKATGGFAQTPGGKADVGTTASGLMAISALKLDPEPYAKPAVEFLGKNAKTFEEVRIAVAGLEAIKATSPEIPRWTEQVLQGRNSDGTFGEGVTKAKDTGSKAVALLRMGVKLDGREAILATLRDAQGSDGGWSQDGVKSDLGTSYRIMRCFYMLGEKPDLDRLRGYIARHRQSDGGSAGAPGGAADGGGTYTCSIMLHWARRLEGEPSIIETAGMIPLFDGHTLEGWDGDKNLWSAKDGKIVGTSPGLNHNDFLATKADYGDFILQLSFRLRGDDSSNSGVQFRSVRVPGHEMSGYQADIGQGYWACLYDESRRNKVLVQASEKALAAIHKNEWNHYTIRAMGDQITLSLNGVTSVTYREPDASIARAGKIALQIHAGKPMTVEFKDIYIQPLPTPGGEGDSPGFHLRTLKTPTGERKYSVYLPVGYDPKKAYPAVLFLHGSGERGTDGVTSAQIGLGAAIAQHPEVFAAIAIFPQAEKTWNNDSDDARAALAALDEVSKAHKVDADQVVLTGLSMGGAGAWSIASAHPDRFAAVVPICGRVRPDSAVTLKGMPAWLVCGTEDGAQTVRNGRTMVKALKDAGGSARLTEYLAVGHNSWDRAYNDLGLLDWMLSQSRRGRTPKGD
jgi:acetyl esterase/lipase/prenyltransferase beta subunit